jgi:DNA-nicking Smr family endonuclease
MAGCVTPANGQRQWGFWSNGAAYSGDLLEGHNPFGRFPPNGLCSKRNAMAKDVDLFKAVMDGVKPIKGRRRPVMAKPKTEAPSTPRVKSVPAVTTPRLLPAQVFDRDVDRALSRGKRSPEAKLDLHGMTLAAAERAVTRFLAEASVQGWRVVLIVTGKGLRLEGGRVFGGRIRAEFLGWLERTDNRARVAGVRAAHARHGGSGAFYVLLRRRTMRA